MTIRMTLAFWYASFYSSITWKKLRGCKSISDQTVSGIIKIYGKCGQYSYLFILKNVSFQMLHCAWIISSCANTFALCARKPSLVRSTLLPWLLLQLLHMLLVNLNSTMHHVLWAHCVLWMLNLLLRLCNKLATDTQTGNKFKFREAKIYDQNVNKIVVQLTTLKTQGQKLLF